MYNFNASIDVKILEYAHKSQKIDISRVGLDI